MSLSKDLRRPIQLIDSLRDYDVNFSISYPRIVVIGTQSAGKSSLIESIAGYDFLPRGEDVVTRRPLELRLRQSPNTETYSVFQDQPDAQIEDFSQVKKIIEQKTNEVAGQKKGIKDSPIVLTIYSPDCFDLSLIDLPGITRIPYLNSDQPNNIEEITVNMTRKYIQDDKALILCVIPANIDLTTSDALKLAREVDSTGERTIGVLTKVDIMDRGTNAISILKNEKVQLKHGYVAVKNRSQEDIKANVTVKAALRLEEEYFRAHQDYRSLPDRVGTKNLSKRLSILLYKHILDCLPKIQKEISEKIEQENREMERLGTSLPLDDEKKLSYVRTCAKKVADELNKVMNGEKTLSDDESFHGYTRFLLLTSSFLDERKKLFVNGVKDIPKEEVIFEIFESKNFSIPGFLPKEVITKRVRMELDKLETPIKNFIEGAKACNEHVLGLILNDAIGIPKPVKRLIQEKTIDYLKDLGEKTKAFTDEYINNEKTLIWSSQDRYFSGSLPSEELDAYKDRDTSYDVIDLGTKLVKKLDILPTDISKALQCITKIISNFSESSVETALSNLKDLKSNPKYKKKLEDIERHKLDLSKHVSKDEIILYYDRILRFYYIIEKNIDDTISKAIVCRMLIEFCKDLENYLVEKFQDDKEEIKALAEEPQLHAEREMRMKHIQKLQDAQKKLRLLQSETLDSQDKKNK